MQTVYRNAGSDGTLNNADDQITKYLFNAAGQTVNAMSEDTEGNLLGVTASAYTENSGTSNKNNRMTGCISSGQAGQNMFSNGGFELPSDGGTSSTATGWNHSGTAARRIHGTSTGLSHSGLMHYNLYNASTSGMASIYREVPLEGGKTYTFSAYVNTQLLLIMQLQLRQRMDNLYYV